MTAANNRTESEIGEHGWEEYCSDYSLRGEQANGFQPIETMADLSAQDEDDIVAGYRAGLNGSPRPGADKSRAWWHGWRNGMVDSGRAIKDDAQIRLAAASTRGLPPPRKVYIAGPDIFFEDWVARAQAAQRICADLGMEAILPIPPQPLAGPGVTEPGDRDRARLIFHACLDAVARADAVVANLTPFRGGEPDSGTVVEAAAAYFLGKPVVGYTTETRCVHEYLGARKNDDGALLCRDGALIEQFGLPCNLMVACVCGEIVIGGVEAALARVAEILVAKVAIDLPKQEEDQP